MRRFKIGSANRFFLLGGIALGSELGLGGSPAMAQIYDFTFNSTLGAGSIEFILSGAQVTGTVAGSGTGILSGGSLSTSGNFMGFGTAPLVLSSSNAPFFSQNTTNYVFIDTSSENIVFASSGGPDDSVGEVKFGEVGGGSLLSNESMTELTPAPPPGSGPLSWLALGLGALFFYRKRLWRPGKILGAAYR